MLQTRRNIFQITRRTIPRQQRRHASSKPSSGHTASAGGETKSTHHSPHPEPVNESLGRGFYITVAAVPLSFALYRYSITSADGTRDADNNAFTRLIAYYSDWNDEWKQRNTLHTDVSAQAARDRNLFQSTPGTQHVDLRFPEIFNTGSPFNVPAGSQVNLDKVIAHYKNQNAAVDEAREARTKAAESNPKPKEPYQGWRGGG